MDVVSAYQEADELYRELEGLVDDMRRDGCQLAEDENDYRRIRALRTMEYRERGLQVTLIRDIVSGLDDVRNARTQRDMSEVLYKADYEALLVKKLHYRTLQEQLAREYGRPSNQ